MSGDGGHEAFEIQIGMRQHGALDAAPAEALDRHLATCERCRRFADSTRSMEKIMTDAGFQLAEGMDWERVRGSIGAAARRAQGEMVLMALLLPLSTAFALWISPPKGLAITAIALLTSVSVCAVAFFQLRRRRDELRWARTSGPAGFRLYREQLDKRVAAARKESWGSVFTTVLLALSFAGSWNTAKGIVISLVLGVLGGGVSLYLLLVEKPRLERERAELGQ